MNPKLDEIQREIDAIKARNKRVEADKAWETSWTRRILITVLTYIVIVIFMVMVDFKTICRCTSSIFGLSDLNEYFILFQKMVDF